MLLYRIISYLFHPVLFSTIATFLYFTIIPNHIPKDAQRAILGIVFATTYVLPVILSYFLKRFNLIENYHLKTIEERKFPVVIMIFLFFLLGRLLLDPKAIDLLAFSFFGCSLSLIIVYVLFSLKIKSSIHTLSIAGLIGLICVLSYHYKQNYLSIIMVLFVVFGLIATARLKLKAHTSTEVYLGFLIGFLSQIIAHLFFVAYNM